MVSYDTNPFQDTDDTRAALMRATYDALCKHGYANLTIQRIGDEFAKSKSLIYQHYDGKDELLVSFLGFMIEHVEDETETPIDDRDALDQLQDHLDHLLAPSLDEDHCEFVRAMTELRAQASHDEAYRKHFTRRERVFREHNAAIIRAGIEQGVFREVDPEQTAELLLTIIEGAMVRRVTTDGSVNIRAVRNELDEFIRSRLLDKD